MRREKTSPDYKHGVLLVVALILASVLLIFTASVDAKRLAEPSRVKATYSARDIYTPNATATPID